MAELVIRLENGSEQVYPLKAGTISLGRGDDCEIQISEKMASRKHLKIRCPKEGEALAGGVVFEDLGSSNGTWMARRGGADSSDAEQRIARKLCYPGDELRIGETRIRVRGAPPAIGGEVPLVSGTLDMVDLGADRAATSMPVSQPTSPAAESTTPDPAESLPRASSSEGRQAAPPIKAAWGKRDTDAIVRSAAVVLIGLGALFGVNHVLGKKAATERERMTAERESRRVLETVTSSDADAFSHRVAEFRAKYPNSPANLSLARLRDQLRERQESRRALLEEVTKVAQRASSGDDATNRDEMYALANRSKDEALQRRVRYMLGEITAKRIQSDQSTFDELYKRAGNLIDRGEPGFALALLSSFERMHPGVIDEISDQRKELRTRILASIDSAHATALRESDKLKSRGDRAGLIGKAWAAVVGTDEAKDLASRLDALAVVPLRSGRTPRATGPTSAPRPGTGGTGMPSEGMPPSEADPMRPSPQDEALLREAMLAEGFMRERRWTKAHAALTKLLAKAGDGLLKREWQARADDAQKLLALVERLRGAVTSSDKPLVRKLSNGRMQLTTVTPNGVSWRKKGDDTETLRWGEIPDNDLFELLRPRGLTDIATMEHAILAAELGRRDDVVAALAPIYKRGANLGLANQLVARHLYGQHTVPEGGYQLYKGKLLDANGHAEVLRREEIAVQRDQASVLLASIEKLPAFKKLKRVRALREQLDKARRYALIAIFNEKHYPYPVNKSSSQYQEVQGEINRRVELVRAVWETQLAATVKTKGRVGMQFERWDEIIARLKELGEPCAKLEASIEPYRIYATGKPINVQSFYYSARERKLREYNHWVITHYNRARTEYASTPERNQIAITNRYRMMMGFTAEVSPGGASFDAIDKLSVVKILDSAKLNATYPLYAVRVDNRLVKAARDHSLDMARRGYFAHFSKPNPETGDPGTDPFTRMARAGYPGGSSENIATASSPQQAHDMWCQSSGHHRNILMSWVDMGTGHGSGRWTQNFGPGAGNRAVIQKTTENIGVPKGRSPTTGRGQGAPSARPR